mgnify:FL=1
MLRFALVSFTLLLAPAIAGAQARPLVDDADASSAAIDEATEVIVVEEDVSVPATRLDQPRRETPSSVLEVDGELLRQRGINDFAGAMATVPGVSPSLRYGGFDHLTIRGFGGEDFLILSDGFRDERGPTVGGEVPVGPMVGLDRIEVLKGPASLLYGPSALGGVINVIRETPQAEPTHEFGAGVGTYGDRRAWLGVGGPASERLGERLLVRFDLRSSIAGSFRGQEDEHVGATGAASFRVRRGHDLDARATWSKSRYATDAGLPTLDGAVPDAIDPATRYNSPYDHLRYDNLELSTSYTAHLTPALVVRERVMWNRFREDYLSTEYIGLDPEAPTSLSRGFFRFDHQGDVALNQLELSWKGRALVQHDLVAGYDLSWMHMRSPSAFGDATTVDAVDFVETQGRPMLPFTSVATRDQLMHGLFLADVMAIGKWRAVGGGRVDIYGVRRVRDALDPGTGLVTEPGTPFEQTVVAPSFRAGVVYLASAALAPYASFTTSVRPVAPSRVPEGFTSFEPETGRQLELGARLALDPRFSLHAAAFHITKRNMLVSRPMMVYEQAGRARSLGAELELEGRFSRVSFDAGYALVNAAYTTYTTADEDLAGRRLPDVPRHTLTGWGSWNGPAGLELGLGGRYAGRAFADRANTTPLPAYLVVDGAASIERGAWTLSLVGKNLLDRNVLDDRGRYYVATIYDTQVTPGSPRTLLFQIERSR